METLLSGAYAPFTSALIGVGLLMLLELVSLLVAGAGLSELFEMLLDTDTFPETAVTNWLLIRDVPISLVLQLALAGFGVTGFILVSVGSMLSLDAPQALVVAIAVAGALLTLRLAGPQLARLFRVHTTAVSQDALLGRTATLLSPSASRGNAGEAKLTDEHGQTHYVMVEPQSDIERFAEGRQIKLVSFNGHLYLACALDA